MSIVYTDAPRADPAVVAGFAEIGVATVHEAQGRTGLMLPYMRPVYGMRDALRNKGLTYRKFGA
jgi:4-hydroxy-4-methyl-2-oxoglutarate aldolase